MTPDSNRRLEMKMNLRNLALAILAGGMAAGAADIISAIGGRAGGKGDGVAALVLQYVASGLLGQTAFQGGGLTVAAGLMVHFGLTIIMAALFVLAARRRPELLRSPWLAGMCYGALLYVVMFYLIVPHSLAPQWKTPKGFWANLSAAMSHGFFVGVPIASVARYFLGTQSEAQVFRPLSTARLIREGSGGSQAA
jgi:hypothetical protein